MPFLIKNTSGDRTKVTQHRSAAGMTPEPSIGGTRLRAGQQMYIEDEHFKRLRDTLYKNFQDGVIVVEQVPPPKEGENLRYGVPMDSPRPHSNPHGASSGEVIKADDENEVTPVLPPPSGPLPPIVPQPAPPLEPEKPIDPEKSGDEQKEGEKPPESTPGEESPPPPPAEKSEHPKDHKGKKSR